MSTIVLPATRVYDKSTINCLASYPCLYNNVYDCLASYPCLYNNVYDCLASYPCL